MALFTKLPSWASILITVIAAVIVVGLVSWGIYTLVKSGLSELPEGEEAVEEGGELPEEEGLPEEEDEFADWKTYRNEEYGFEAKSPEDWNGLEDVGSISIEEKEKFKKDYEECLKEKDEGTCKKIFGGDYNDLLKRIDFIKDVQDENLTHDKATHCTEGGELPCEPIRGFDFDCFAIGGYMKLRTIHNDNLNMNLIRTIGFCGYDFGLDNLYYHAYIVINDNLIKISFYLLPFNVFDKVDQLYRELGYKTTESGARVCDAACNQNVASYYENIDLNSELIKEIIETYDNVVKSVKFLE